MFGRGWISFARSGPAGSPDLGDSVVVIGGGNTAVDTALTCRRLGARDVRLVCVESREEMPAFDAEVREALEEGVIIETGWGPLEIRAEQGQVKVDFGSCLSLRDEEGKFNPRLARECGRSLEADTVILAVGQTLEALGPASGSAGGRRPASGR